MSVLDEIGDNSADGVEERTRSGGILPEGLYHARLNGAKEIESKAKGTPGYELTFVVTAGPFSGAEVTDTLWRTDHQRSKDRIKLFAHRLGLLKKSADGKTYVPAEGKSAFLDVLDTPTVIEVAHEQDQHDPNKKWVRLAYCGVHDPADAEVKKLLAAGGKRPAKKDDGKAAAGSGGKPADKPANGAAGQGAGGEKRKIGKGEL